MNTLNTTDYKKFRFLKGNRPIAQTKIKKITESVKAGLNLFKYCPIMVNEDYYIIDGQHRFEACKQLRLPIFFVVVPKVSLLDIARLNSNATRWNAADFFNCFIQTGNKDYEVLQKFKEKYELNVSIAAGLLMNGSTAQGGREADSFREGKFKVVHQEKAEKIMRAVVQYIPMTEDNKIATSRNFLKAVQLLLASPGYKHSEVIEKLSKNKSKIQHKPDYKGYIFHIEELFNKNNSKRIVLYHSAKDSGGGVLPKNSRLKK